MMGIIVAAVVMVVTRSMMMRMGRRIRGGRIGSIGVGYDAWMIYLVTYVVWRGNVHTHDMIWHIYPCTHKPSTPSTFLHGRPSTPFPFAIRNHLIMSKAGKQRAQYLYGRKPSSPSHLNESQVRQRISQVAEQPSRLKTPKNPVERTTHHNKLPFQDPTNELEKGTAAISKTGLERII